MQNKAPIYSGASPEQVAADLEPLVAFQDEGLPLDALNQLLEERLFPHLMQYIKVASEVGASPKSRHKAWQQSSSSMAPPGETCQFVTPWL